MEFHSHSESLDQFQHSQSPLRKKQTENTQKVFSVCLAEKEGLALACELGQRQF